MKHFGGRELTADCFPASVKIKTRMEETVASLIADSVGWGITVLVLVGLYRLANRFLTIHETFLEELLEQGKVIADALRELSDNPDNRHGDSG